MCQLPEGTPGSAMAAAVFAGVDPAWTWIACLDGQPACAFGFQAFSVPVWVAWAWGTRHMPRTIPAITRWCWGQEQRLLDAGVRRVEARSIEGHDEAHRWLERLGCSRVCELPDCGRSGELFYLYAWHIGAGRPTRNTVYRKNRNVLQHEDAQAAAGAAAGLAAVEAGG